MDLNLNPSGTQETFTPDLLHAGDIPVRTRDVTIKSGENLKRGALLGVDGDGKYLLSLSAANDGSEDPNAILADDVDASEGDAAGIAYIRGDFNEDRVTFGTGHTADSVREALRALSIYLHKPVSSEPAS